MLIRMQGGGKQGEQRVALLIAPCAGQGTDAPCSEGPACKQARPNAANSHSLHPVGGVWACQAASHSLDVKGCAGGLAISCHSGWDVVTARVHKALTGGIHIAARHSAVEPTFGTCTQACGLAALVSMWRSVSVWVGVGGGQAASWVAVGQRRRVNTKTAAKL